MSNFRNRLRKLGFISIEVVLIGSVVLAGGLIGVDRLMRNGSGASNHQQGVFNSLFNNESEGENGGSETNVPLGELAPVIYWGVDGSGRLIISDEEVSSNKSGNFVREAEFIQATDIPWSSYSDQITSVEVIKVSKEISPVSLDNWFYGLTNCSNLKLESLRADNAISMKHTFAYAGYQVSSFTIEGLKNWNTQNVKDMSYAFNGAGGMSPNWNIGDLSLWKTGNVENMEGMFAVAGHVANTWNIGNISSWNTSNVKNMSGMFNMAASGTRDFSLDLSHWDVSNVTDMTFMFRSVGHNATNWSISGLQNWNTQNVKSMAGMFEYSGTAANSYSMNVSSWNTQNVENMSNMFNKAGEDATYSFNLSEWNVAKVTNHNGFDTSVEGKIILPDWNN